MLQSPNEQRPRKRTPNKPKHNRKQTRLHIFKRRHECHLEQLVQIPDYFKDQQRQQSNWNHQKFEVFFVFTQTDHVRSPLVIENGNTKHRCQVKNEHN